MQMKTNFTQGEWIAQGYYITTIKGEIIAASPLAQLPDDVTPSDEQMTEAIANVRLAAASKEMFELLLQVREHYNVEWKQLQDSGNRYASESAYAMYQWSDRAINKALGIKEKVEG